jgi:hypothetical protein
MEVTHRQFGSDITTGIASSKPKPVPGTIEPNQERREHHHYIIRGGTEGRERLRVLARVMRETTAEPVRSRRDQARDGMPRRWLWRR